MRVDRRTARTRALAEALQGAGVLHLKEAASRLGVSEMTIRRDIALAPERFGYLGGYILPRTGDAPYVMAQEQGAHAAAKAALCGLAATTVEEDDTVFIDCGTTTPHLVRQLPDLRLTVVCYALNIAAPLAASPKVRLILLGGLFNPSSASFAVDDGLATLERLRLNKAFVSAGGVHAERGVSCSNFHEVPVKQAAMRLAERRLLLADGSKIGKVRPAFFAELSAFDVLVTTPTPALPDLHSRFSGTILTPK